jgi:hypothetical protein
MSNPPKRLLAAALLLHRLRKRNSARYTWVRKKVRKSLYDGQLAGCPAIC